MLGEKWLFPDLFKPQSQELFKTFQAQFPQIQGLNTTEFKAQIKVDYCYNTEDFCNEK